MTDELDPESLRRLLDATAALPRSVEPESDAWPAVRDRIDALRVTPIVPGRGDQLATHAAAGAADAVNYANAARPSRRWTSPRWLAAAAVLLVVLSSTVTWLVVRNDPAALVAEVDPFAVRRTQLQAQQQQQSQTSELPQAGRRAEPRATVTAVAAAPLSEGVFARYNVAATELAHALDARRSRLDPRTVAVLDSCLTRIDAAIAEARAALKEDPRNAVVSDLLTATYRQKLDLLKRAGDLPLRTI